MKFIGMLFAVFLLSAPVLAKHDSDHPLTADDWKEVMEKVVLLEDSGLLPTLLPVIMRHKDTLQLTDGSSMPSVPGEKPTTRTW